MKQLLMVTILASIFAGTPFLSMADGDYQYIVSGYPVANPNQSLASEGIPLATGRYACRSVASPLEARFRTFLESNGSKLLSTKFIGIRCVIR